MNLLNFACPSCGQPFSVSEADVGHVVQCPSCGHEVEIPRETDEQTVAPGGSDTEVPAITPKLSNSSRREKKTRGEGQFQTPQIDESNVKQGSESPESKGPESKGPESKAPDWGALPTPEPDVVANDKSNFPDITARESTGVAESPSGTPETADHLLPPQFRVFDPQRAGIHGGRNERRVVIPDGQGGTAQIDSRILHVKDGANDVQLIAMSPEQRARRRLIQNVIVIVIAIGMMAIVYFLLR